MMKKTFFVLIAMALMLSGCFFPVRATRVIGSGDVITETRRVANFSAVELNGVGTLKIEQGETESLEITAEENLMPYLQSVVRGKNLVLGVEGFVNISPKEPIIFRLTVKNLERVETSGLGNIEIAQLVCDDFALEISGSGNATIVDLQAENLKVEVSGMGNVTITGTVEEQRIDFSGAGNYDAPDLYSDQARVEISGTAHAVVWAEKELDVDLSGMGSLQYYGSPQLSTDISGAGSIESLGEK